MVQGSNLTSSWILHLVYRLPSHLDIHYNPAIKSVRRYMKFVHCRRVIIWNLWFTLKQFKSLWIRNCCSICWDSGSKRKLVIFGFWKVRQCHTIYKNVPQLNTFIVCTYFPLEWNCKIICMPQLYVFLHVLHVHSCALVALLENSHSDTVQW